MRLRLRLRRNFRRHGRAEGQIDDVGRVVGAQPFEEGFGAGRLRWGGGLVVRVHGPTLVVHGGWASGEVVAVAASGYLDGVARLELVEEIGHRHVASRQQREAGEVVAEQGGRLFQADGAALGVGGRRLEKVSYLSAGGVRPSRWFVRRIERRPFAVLVSVPRPAPVPGIRRGGGVFGDFGERLDDGVGIGGGGRTCVAGSVGVRVLVLIWPDRVGSGAVEGGEGVEPPAAGGQVVEIGAR